MLNSARSRAQEQVSEEAVTVSAHRHQIATLSLDPVDNFGYRVPISQFDLHRNSGGAKFLADLRQVCGVLRNFGADGVLPIGPGGPAISDVQQHDPAARQFRQRLNVFDDRAVRRGAVHGHENSFVHGHSFGYPPTMTRQAPFRESCSPHRSITVITIALPQPASNKNQPSFHEPIRLRELVKCIRGIMASGSCSARTTWLKVSNSLTLLCPRIPMIRTAGIMARARVMRRRSQGAILHCMKPSMTT